MPDTKLARGRPKGTGLDDRQLLQSLFSLLNADPELKPTTAIKSLGVTDPSAIRRLRDKCKLALSDTSQVMPAAQACQSVKTSTPARIMALRSANPALRTKPVATPSPELIKPTVAAPIAAPAQTAKTAQQRAGDDRRQLASDWFSVWADIGVHSMTTTLNVQWILYGHVLNSPPIRAALSQQSVLTDFAAAWCAFGPDPGKTIH